MNLKKYRADSSAFDMMEYATGFPCKSADVDVRGGVLISWCLARYNLKRAVCFFYYAMKIVIFGCVPSIVVRQNCFQKIVVRCNQLFLWCDMGGFVWNVNPQTFCVFDNL